MDLPSDFSLDDGLVRVGDLLLASFFLFLFDVLFLFFVRQGIKSRRLNIALSRRSRRFTRCSSRRAARRDCNRRRRHFAGWRHILARTNQLLLFIEFFSRDFPQLAIFTVKISGVRKKISVPMRQKFDASAQFKKSTHPVFAAFYRFRKKYAP